jgi:hypothetical protein
MPLPMKEECCCLCPLIDRPFISAKLEFLGMAFDVTFAPGDFNEATCCQEKLSTCKDTGDPEFIRDCYVFSLGTPLIWQEDISQYLSTSGPWCDWPLVIVPLKAVDDCCNSSNYRFETTGINRLRFWMWIQAIVRFRVCYCKTEEGKPGYRVRIEISWRITRILNTSRLIKYRFRKYFRICCDPPEDPGDPEMPIEIATMFSESGYPCTPGCYSMPPEPLWTDNSGNNIPNEPFLWYPQLGMNGCPVKPPLNPVFDPACIGSCSEIDLIPGCLDPANYYIEQYCTDETIQTCFGPATIRVPTRWNVVGLDGRASTNLDGGGVWESGVLALTDACAEDMDENPMIIQVSRAPQEIELISDCKDVEGNELGPYKITMPDIIPVCLIRSGPLSAPCSV